MANLLTSREEFQRWTEHPGTVAFLEYLRDRQEALMVAWARGSQMAPEQQAQAVMLGQLVSLSADEIASDYGIEVTENVDD